MYIYLLENRKTKLSLVGVSGERHILDINRVVHHENTTACFYSSNRPLTSDINKATRELPLIGQFLVFRSFSVNPRKFLKYLDQPGCQEQPHHLKAHLPCSDAQFEFQQFS